MVSAIAIAVWTALQSGSLSATWFPQPTGANGFEEYARAADLIMTREFGTFAAWKPMDGVPPDFPVVSGSFGARGSLPVGRDFASALKPVAPDEGYSFQAQLADADFAKYCSLGQQEFSKTLDLIRAGNQKPLVLPKATLDANRFVGELQPFLEGISDLGLRSAYANLAEGHTGIAVQIIIDLLSLADRLTRVSTSGSISSRTLITGGRLGPKPEAGAANSWRLQRIAQLSDQFAG